VFIGTLTNIVTVLVGTAIGAVAGARIPERLQETIVAALGLLTAALAIRETLAVDDFIVVLAAVLLGAIAGEALRIEQALERAGNALQRRLAGTSADLDVELPEAAEPPDPVGARSRFAEGFVISTLVFCVGPLTVLGAINDGLGDPELLLVKAGLDGFASIAFAAVFGWGVGLAAISILVIQGGIALGAGALDGVLTEPMIDALAATGGVLLLGVATRLLELKRIRVANLLPALVIAPLLVAWFR
jgi:uncharacterized membrane protein YqgA involved in biofilm formation